MNETKEQEISRLAQTNRFAVIGYGIITLFISLVLLSSVISGGRGISDVIISVVLGGGMILWNVYVYCKNRENRVLRYTTFLMYMILCSYLLFTGNNPDTYVYLFLAMVFAILYFDYRYIIIISGIVNVVNILNVIVLIVVLEDSKNFTISSSYMIHLASVMAFTIILCKVTKLSNKFNGDAIEKIEQGHLQQQKIADRGIALGNQVSEELANSNVILAEIAQSSAKASTAVHEISKGTQSTSENIQNQTIMTQKIHTAITETKDNANHMAQLLSNTAHAVQEGIELTVKLRQQAGNVAKSNTEVSMVMEQLTGKTVQVQEITDVIIKIANNTNLLALNASIEAARAGEQGAGFAVVADQIRTLAEQTKDSIVNVKKVLEELDSSTCLAQEAVDRITHETTEQNSMIEDVNTRFGNVSETVNSLEDNMGSLHAKVEDLVKSNEVIVDSIGSLSAASEEITASSEQAYEMSEKNKEAVDQVSLKIQKIAKEAEQFRNLG